MIPTLSHLKNVEPSMFAGEGCWHLKIDYKPSFIKSGVPELLNILIFSLSCGIFFSALCRRTGQSIACTLFFLASITLIPQTYIGFGGTNEAWSLTSPAYAMYRASSPVIGPAAVGWGLSLIHI